MNPTTVLNLQPNDNAEIIRDEWLKQYRSYAEEFTNTQALAELLSARVKRACDLVLERRAVQPATSHDEEYYLSESQRMSAEDAELDGDFPLGNQEDAAFAGIYFTISDLVSIQLGYKNLVNCGYYTEYNDAVLVRKGFIEEMNGEWLKAADCYRGVSGSLAVQNREYACRRKAKARGEQLYAQAQGYMETGEWNEVYWPLQCAADMGNTDAMTDLGLARLYGQFGCARDTEEALNLLRTAAVGGNSRAAFEICELYDSGLSIDAHEAKKMCEKAAELGDKKAAERLKDGFDLRPINEILEEQAVNGSSDAMWRLYLLYRDKNDMENAREWLDFAVEAGQVDALLSVADSYDKKGVDAHSAQQALQYYRRAAEAGSVRAILLLGDRELADTHISFSEMAIQLKNSAENNLPMPDNNIVTQHTKQLAWYELAAQSGDESAITAVCYAYILGYPVKQNYDKAFTMALRGADEGSAACMYLVGYLYENGFGVDMDVDAAIDYYTQAAEKGVRSAILRLYQIYSQGLQHIPADAQKAAHYLFLSGEGRD